MTEVTLQFPDNTLMHRFVSTNADSKLVSQIARRRLKARLTAEQLILALELYGAVVKMQHKKVVQ